MQRLRVAALQYNLRPVASFDQFAGYADRGDAFADSLNNE